jgi:hypothetical protein
VFRFKILICVGLLIPTVVPSPAGAEAPRQTLVVGAHVDKTEVATGETLTFRVTMMGPIRISPKVRLTSFEGFQIISTGQSQQIQIRQGRTETTLTLSYLLAPVTPGTHTLGPVKVEFQGKVYETKPIEVTVVPGHQRNSPKLESKPSEEPVLEGGVIL